MTGSLWTCPACGRQFRARNQWHSCRPSRQLEERLAELTPGSASVVRALADAVAANGPSRVTVGATLVTFALTRTFAAAHPHKRWVDVELLLPAPVVEPQPRMVQRLAASSYAHTWRIHSCELVTDPVFVDLVARAYASGDQSHFGGA